MTKTVGVILAGGRSTRMGGVDKCLMPLHGQSLLAHAKDRLTPQVRRLVVNTNSDAAGYMFDDCTVIADNFTGFAGPLAGVLAGMEWAKSQGASQLVSIAADTPFFPVDLVARLEAGLKGSRAKIAMTATVDKDGKVWRHPTFTLWPVELATDLRQALQNGTRKVVAFANSYGVCDVVFEYRSVDPFFNVNMPDDFVRAEQIFKEVRS